MPNNEHWIPCLPQDAPFEIRRSAGKGRGGFATKDMEAGACVLHEKSLLVICKPEAAIRAKDIETAFSCLNKCEQEQFLSVGSSAKNPLQGSLLFDTFMRNKFQLMRARVGQKAEPDGQGMYLLCSRFNHSCVPNAAVVEAPSCRLDYAHEIYATRPIARGEEITINYDPIFNYLTTEIRRSAGTWDFVCDCPACNISDPFHRISDMRRALLRGLYYLLNGTDAPGCEGRKIPVTREAAKEKLTARNRTFLQRGSKALENFITWSMLSGYLLEAEGLADLASEHFRHATVATCRLRDAVGGMHEVHRSNASLWALKSRDSIKSCRPADHVDVLDREQLLLQVLRLTTF